MGNESDVALLSTLRSQVDDLVERVSALASEYGTTSDSAVAADLYAAERALLTVRRTLERASGAIRGAARG